MLVMDESNREQLSVNSETDVLEKVIIHRPDIGISRVTPENAEKLLYDDIVFLKKMQVEHDIFTDVLRAFAGKENVYEAHFLLAQVLEEDGVKHEFLSDIAKSGNFGHETVSYLNSLDTRRLATILISGYDKSGDKTLMNPLPNFVFTRDVGIVVNDHLLIGSAMKLARKRETNICRLIFRHHPLFECFREEEKVVSLSSFIDPEMAIEGGDVMLIDKDHLLIGITERTSEKAFDEIKDQLLGKGAVKNVVKVEIPKQRAYMHIDTVFTKIDHHDLVIFEPILEGTLDVSKVTAYRHDGSSEEFANPKDFWLSIDPDTRFILSGNGKSPSAEREQWTDGCNLVAVRPGVAISYDRNIRTASALKEAGYEILEAEAFLQSVKAGLDPESLEKTIIALPSSELSRGRGGPHCMTMPIKRSPKSKTETEANN